MANIQSLKRSSCSSFVFLRAVEKEMFFSSLFPSALWIWLISCSLSLFRFVFIKTNVFFFFFSIFFLADPLWTVVEQICINRSRKRGLFSSFSLLTFLLGFSLAHFISMKIIPCSSFLYLSLKLWMLSKLSSRDLVISPINHWVSNS